MTNWEIVNDGHYPFTRSFLARPRETLVFEVPTVERYKGKLIEAVYDAKVSLVRISWSWDEKGSRWWGQATVELSRINPKTGESYSYGNWKAETIREHYLFSKMVGSPDYISYLAEETRPRTKVTVTEVPE